MVGRGTSVAIAMHPSVDGDAPLHILRRALNVAAVTLAVLAAAFAVLAVASYFELSQAREHRHPPADAPIREKLYSSWKMPTNPTDPTATSGIATRAKSAVSQDLCLPVARSRSFPSS